MNLKGIPESKNFVDTTAAPWYDPHKLIANAVIGMNRLIGSKKQAELDKIQAERDANPITPMDTQANFNSKVVRKQNGWEIQRPGDTFHEFAPDYSNSDQMNAILKQAGIVPK